MTRKKPVTDGKKTFPLENSIDELENLIADKSRIDHDDIPVLDEIIDPETFYEADDPGLFNDDGEEIEAVRTQINEQILSQEQIEMLVGQMDQRISGELDELVSILKDALKNSIITEIKTRLESRPQDKSADNADPHEDS
ncbi:MAG TPA: hypothetical protein VJ981_00810 [Gammaproteobacteria bacterium]|nr:hypothetical protein [Gammaproteobacteria bacterium]